MVSLSLAFDGINIIGVHLQQRDTFERTGLINNIIFLKVT
jgi:hypothetical protein